jgi:hypothetical protein
MLTLLAGCSFAPISIPVADVTIPGNSSVGFICYTPTPITESAPVGFTSADYRATATYTSTGMNTATVTVYGRTTPPPTPCVLPSAADLRLSGPLTLVPGAAQEILVGGPEYGDTLAGLITAPSYYFGASLAGGVLVGLEERIMLTEGEISVYY